MVGPGEPYRWEMQGDPSPSGRGAAAAGAMLGPREVTWGGPGWLALAGDLLALFLQPPEMAWGIYRHV